VREGEEKRKEGKQTNKKKERKREREKEIEIDKTDWGRTADERVREE
jgi:hypothetical protein